MREADFDAERAATPLPAARGERALPTSPSRGEEL
jgi:hypothetical protein